MLLLSGPATNVGSIVVLLKFLGRRVVTVYILSIATVALAAGYTLDWIYRTWQINPVATFGKATGFVPEPVKVVSALVVLALLARSLWRSPVPEEWTRLGDWFAATVKQVVESAADFDVIHSHLEWWSLPLARTTASPTSFSAAHAAQEVSPSGALNRRRNFPFSSRALKRSSS